MLRLQLAAAALFCVPLACTTLVKDPGQSRSQHPLTLGVPGALVHPARSLGLLVNAEIPQNSTAHVVSGGHGDSSFSINPDDAGGDNRAITQRDLSARLSVLQFPSDKSFFFWGVTSRYGQTRAGYSERTAGFNVDEPAKTTVEWTDRYGTIGGTLGTSLISQRDSQFFTSVFGVSVEGQIYGSRNFANDGERHDVDTASRDATLAAYDDFRKKATFHYYLMSGFSF